MSLGISVLCFHCRMSSMLHGYFSNKQGRKVRIGQIVGFDLGLNRF